MYNKTSLWLIATLMSSVPYAYAGKPSTPSTQQPQSPAPANSPSPNPGSPTPANPTQGSDTPSAPDNNNNQQQPGLLEQSKAMIAGVSATGAAVGAVGLLGTAYLAKKGYDHFKKPKQGGDLLFVEPDPEPTTKKPQPTVAESPISSMKEFKKVSADILKGLAQPTQVDGGLSEEVKTAIQTVGGHLSKEQGAHEYSKEVHDGLATLKDHKSFEHIKEHLTKMHSFFEFKVPKVK